MLYISHSQKENDFNTLYQTTRDGLFHFLSRYSKDFPLIEDIMQQCYLTIWERMDEVKRPQEAGPLVQTYARNLLIDTIRRRVKEDTVWLDQLQQEVEQVMDTGITETGRQQLLHLDAAIEQLPVAVRTVYVLHRENGLSYKEIAARLSISVSMVEKQMSKAIRLLKKETLTDMSLVLLLAAGFYLASCEVPSTIESPADGYQHR